MADESQVTVRLKLLGAQLMARDAKRAAGGLSELDRGGRGAAKGLGTIRGGRVQGQLGLVARGTVLAQRGMRSVQGAAVAAGRALRRVAMVATAGAAAAFGVMGRETIAFDEGMRNVNSIAQLTEAQLKRLSGGVLSLAGQTAQAPKTLAEGLYDLVSSGFDSKQSMLILRSSARAASAGLTDTATSTKAVAAVLNAYRLPAAKAGLVSDQLFKTVDRGVISFETLSQNIGDVLPFAASLGVGLEQVGASISTMTKAGISGPETMTRIKAVMSTMLKPGKTLAKTLQDLGFESGEALIKQKGLQGALEALAKATGGSKQKLAALFPNVRALGGALALTGKNARGARDDLAGMGDAGGATARALSQQSRSVAYQWRKLKAQATALGISIGSRLVPAALSAVRALSGLGSSRVGKTIGKTISDLTAGFKGTAVVAPRKTRALGERALGSATSTAGAPTSAAGPSAMARIGEQARSVLGKLGDTAKRIGPVLLGAGRQLLDAFKPAMPFFQNILLPLLEGVGKGVIGSVVAAFRVAIPIIKIVASVLGFVGRAAAPLTPVIRGLGMVIGFLFGGPILKALGMLGKFGIVFRLLAVPLRIATAGVRGVASVVGRMIGAFGKAFTFVSRFAGTLQGGARKAAVGAVNMVGAIINVIARLPGRAAALAGRVVGSIASKLGGSVSRLSGVARSLGKGLVDGVVNAIKGAPGAIVGALMSLVPGPVKGVVKSALGIVGLNAHGGTVRSPLQVVGEHGPELAALPQGSQVVTASDTRRMLRAPRQPTVMAPAFAGGPLYAHLVVNLDGKPLHEGVHKVERQLAETR